MMVPDFDSICRLCLTKNEKMLPIFGENGKSRSKWIERIEAYTCLKISKSDGLPTAICLECVDKLDLIKEFRDQCERSDAVLREYLPVIKLHERHGDIMEDKYDDVKDACNFKKGSVLKQRRKRDHSPEEGNNHLTEEEASSTVVLSDDMPQQELSNVEPCSGVPMPSSQSSKNKIKGRSKSFIFRNRIDIRKGDGNEDNEYAWPGSLSDKEMEQSNSDDQQTENDINALRKDRKRSKSRRKYECEFCGRGFHRSNHLAQHELTHTKDKPFNCSYCDKSFWYKNSLIGHIKQTHTGDVNYTCEECGRGFFQRSEFNRHKPIHSSETPFKCTDCGMAFKLVKNLRRHQKVHTALRTHTCQFCGKSFRMLQTLRVHLLLHTGEKPFKCTFCGKGFSQSAPLKAHTRTHTGERPYVCSFCGEAFPTGNALKAHTFKHTGIHPNSCKDCNLVFKRKKDLVMHWDHVHNGAATEPLQVEPLLPQEPLQSDEKSREPTQQYPSQQQPEPLVSENTTAVRQSVSVAEYSHDVSNLKTESIVCSANPSLTSSGDLQDTSGSEGLVSQEPVWKKEPL